MPTGIKCCAPACPSGHAGCLDVVSYHRFPTNENRRKLWLAKLPIKNWLPTANSRLCERHFADSCYKSISTDSNTTRSEKRVDLCKKLLKPDAYPTIWPNCPTYLTEQQPAPIYSAPWYFCATDYLYIKRKHFMCRIRISMLPHQIRSILMFFRGLSDFEGSCKGTYYLCFDGNIWRHVEMSKKNEKIHGLNSSFQRKTWH